MAKLILKDRANTGRILNSLEEKNLITRCVDVKNNRLVKRLAITVEGNRQLEDINKKIKDFLKNISCKFSPEETDRLQHSLREFRKSLKEFAEMNI